MASAKKQEQLEAGKRKLEEFRRKKAAEKAKKATSAGQLRDSGGVPNEKQPLDTHYASFTEFNSVGTSDAVTEGHLKTKAVDPNIAAKESENSSRDNFSRAGVGVGDKPSNLASNNGSNTSARKLSDLNNEAYEEGVAPAGVEGFRNAKETLSNKKGDVLSSAQDSSDSGNNHVLDNHTSHIEEYLPSVHPDYHGLHSANDVDGSGNDLSRGNSDASGGFIKNSMPWNFDSTPPPDRLSNSIHGDGRLTSFPYPESFPLTSNMTETAFGYKPKLSSFSDMEDLKFSGSADYVGSINHSSPWTAESRYADYDSDALSSSNHAPPSAPAASRRSRPSFLDSIQIPKGPSSLPPPLDAVNSDLSNSKIIPLDVLGSSFSERSASSSVAYGSVDQFNNATGHRHDFFSQKNNEDFAALEQHIEDLTQEKFSLQRALEASRALAESLVSENSTLTDRYNQQGSVVSQLKLDLQKLQEEIIVLQAELEAVKIEYANAKLESNAADERAKLLASEVIELEEKALRLRSNELKLERQLENSEAEISSYNKRLSTLEKDRQDLQATINALCEEKKLLQSKLREASGKPIDVNNTSYHKKDVSTSTYDLGTHVTSESTRSENFDNAFFGDDITTSQLAHENINPSLEVLSSTFPSDQLRMVQNINTLLAELVLEKEQLVQALSAESSQSSKLLELNKELIRKLEAQTQRLELLTAQSMANDNVYLRQLDSQNIQEIPTYADEGDEVVERVLGWIIKLFPGGPSRRRHSTRF